MQEYEMRHLRAGRTADGSLAITFWANELPYQVTIRDGQVLRGIREALEDVAVEAGDHPPGSMVVPECRDCGGPMRRANPLQLICPECLRHRSSSVPRVRIADEHRAALLALRTEHRDHPDIAALLDSFLRNGDPHVLEELLGLFSIDHQDVWPVEAHELVLRIWAGKPLDEEL